MAQSGPGGAAEAATGSEGTPGGDTTGEGLGDAARRLYGEGGDAARSLLRTLDALQSLVGHEAALARAALPQAVLFAGIGVALGLAAWLYLMALLVAWLHLWLGWPGAMAVAALVSGLGTALCFWRCMVLLRLSRFEATRRQLRKLRELLRGGADPTPPGESGPHRADASAPPPGDPA